MTEGKTRKKPEKRTIVNNPKRVNLKVRIKKSARQNSFHPGEPVEQIRQSKKKKHLKIISTGENKVTGKDKEIIPREFKEHEKRPENKKNKLWKGGVINKRIERDKRLMMWSGVVFFMILISFFWLYNTKQVFQKTSRENRTDFSFSNWSEMTEEISDKMNQLKDDLEGIKSFGETGTATPATLSDTSTSSLQVSESAEQGENLFFSTTTESYIDPEKLDDIKKKLEELEEKLKEEQES
jgi:cytoskeletal protein RodZ